MKNSLAKPRLTAFYCFNMLKLTAEDSRHTLSKYIIGLGFQVSLRLL